MENSVNEFDEDLDNLKCILNSAENCLRIESVECTRGSNAGDNYMSVIKRLSVTGVNSENQAFTKSYILKRQIPSLSRRELFRCDVAFENEINAYNIIVPMFKNNGNISIFPDCYFSGKDTYGELVILKNLKQDNFFMADRLQGLDLQHCQVVLEALAKFHATSIYLKTTNKDMFTEKCQQIKEIVYCPSGDVLYKSILESSVRETINSLKKSNNDGSLSIVIDQIQKLETKIYEIIREYVTHESDSFNVICHGDLWVNNIMFRNDFDGKICDIKFFDLQAMRYSSPVIDILHFIYTSTKWSLRKNYLNQLLSIYTKALHSYLDNLFKSDFSKELEMVKKSYSLENVVKDFKGKILYGLAVSMWILPAVTFDPNNIPNLDNVTDENTSTKDFNVENKLTPEYHARIKETALEFYQNGYLENI